MEQSIFLNSDYIVIEYIDFIKSPYLILLKEMKNNPKLNEILKIEQIMFLDDEGLYEWYINRKHQNFLIDLNRFPDEISDDMLDNLLEDQMNITHLFYELSPMLLLETFLRTINTKKIVNEVIIYHPHKNFYAKNDLENIMGTNYTFMTNFDMVLDKAGSNSTYFLSDIKKIQRMKEKDLLKFSSITLPLEYRYNKRNMTEFDFDFDALFKESPFKLSYTRACTIEPKG